MRTEVIENGKRLKWYLSKPELQALLAFAATDAESVPHMCVVCWDETSHAAMATDGHRAVIAETEDITGHSDEPMRNMIAVEHVARLVRMAEKDETITLVFGVERVTCDMEMPGQLSLFDGARAFDLPVVMEGRFPDIRATIPAPTSAPSALEGVSIDAELLAPIKLVQRAAESSMGVRMAIPKEALAPVVIRAENAEQQTTWTALIMPIRAPGDEQGKEAA